MPDWCEDDTWCGECGLPTATPSSPPNLCWECVESENQRRAERTRLEQEVDDYERAQFRDIGF